MLLETTRVVVLFAIVISNTQVTSCWELTITPDHIHARNNSRALILCATDQPLSDCNFKVFYDKQGESVTLDLSESRTASTRSLRRRGSHRNRIVYHGSGLEKGECGMSWKVPPGRHYVGCRVRAVNGTTWKYRFMTVFVDSLNPMPLELSPSYRLASPGEPLQLQCSTTERASEITVQVKSAEDHQVSATYTSVEHPGSLAVAEINNGLVWCEGWSERGQREAKAAVLVVKKPPSPPDLQIEPPISKVGDVMTARCRVRDGRPAADITWYLDDVVVPREEIADETSRLEWRWPWNAVSVVEAYRRTVGLEDNGKVVKCEVRHVTGEVAAVATKRVAVERSCGVYSHKRPQPPPSTTPSSEMHISPRISVAAGVTESGIDIVSRIAFPDEDNVDADRQRPPWVVAIYRREYGEYQHKCGGTLISTTIVVTSANCFWDDSYNRPHNASLYMLAVGKYHRSWATVDPGEQRIPIETVTLNMRYRGRKVNYANDIAVVRLASTVQLTPNVGVACVDWEGRTDVATLDVGNTGLISGWGIDSTGHPSATLLSVELPYIARDTCYDDMKPETRMFLTVDKFCAGYLNRQTSVCPGDSGGGLVFLNEEDNAYYLRGVASISFRPFADTRACYTDLYTGFTTVSDYITWLKKLV